MVKEKTKESDVLTFRDAKGSVTVHRGYSGTGYVVLLAEGTVENSLWTSTFSEIFAQLRGTEIFRAIVDTRKAVDRIDTHGFIGLAAKMAREGIGTLRVAVLSAVDETGRAALAESIYDIVPENITIKLCNDRQAAEAWVVGRSEP